MKKCVAWALSGLPAVRPDMTRFGLAMIGSPVSGSANGRSGMVRPGSGDGDEHCLLELAERHARVGRRMAHRTGADRQSPADPVRSPAPQRPHQRTLQQIRQAGMTDRAPGLRPAARARQRALLVESGVGVVRFAHGVSP